MRKAKSGKYYYPSKRNNRKRMNKKQFINTRKAVVETKAVGQGDNTTDADASETIFLSVSGTGNAIINPMNYALNQGVSDWTMTGDEITCKYLKQKLRFAFPEAANSITKPYRIQVIHGFITRPAGFTAFDTPNGGTINRDNYIDHLTKLITYPWNDKDDFINFRTKEKTLYRVIKKQWVRPNRNRSIGMPVSANNLGAAGIAGSVPDVTLTLTWPVMGRKWRMTYSSDTANTNPSPDPFWYNNESWVPFTVIYCPEYDNVNNGENATDADKVTCQHNSKLWFTDS